MPARHAAPALGVFALVVGLGLDEGGYAPTAWGWSAVVALIALVVVIWRGARRPSRPAQVLIAGLAGFAVWAGASTLWSSHVSASVLETQRVLLYVAVAALFSLAPRVPLLAGSLAATTCLCGIGLSRWLLGDPEVPLSADPEAALRLSEPLGYANGVGALAAMGLVLSAGVAARAPRAWAAAAAATVPLQAATLYFTFSRGAWAALGIGLVAAVAIGPARLQFAAVAAVLAPFAAVAVLAADSIGRRAALAGAIVGVCVLAAGVLIAVGRARIVVGPRARTAFAAALVAVPIIAVAGVLVRLGGPAGALESFEAAPAPVHGDVAGRVLSVSGSSRADYWSAAWDTYRERPAIGEGAGTFARAWLAERDVRQPVRDAHSLYLETLAETGPVGLAVLLLALLAPFAGRRSAWTPAAVGPYTAFLVHAAQDWDWELPAVTVTALACAVAATAPPTGPRIPRLVAILPVVLCAVAVFAYAGNRTLGEATAAADRADARLSADRSRAATRLQPWSGEPWRSLGEAQLTLGDTEAARRSFRRGLDRDDGDWELWLDLGLASDGGAQRAAWSRAASLNPLSPELKELGFRRR